ncbi:MAG: phosphate acyltransferase [Planctomycetaceae bacterium]
MSLTGFQELFAEADRLRRPLPVVAAGGSDATVLAALHQSLLRKWVDPVLTGSETAIQKLADELEIPLDGFRIVDSDDPAAAAVAEVRAGRAVCLMKGQIATPDLMKAVLSKDAGLRTKRLICQIVLMEVPRDHRRFLLADTGITIRPTLEQKIDILQSLESVASALREPETPGDWKPRIGVMAATEKTTDAMPDTLEAAELARRNADGEWPGCIVQGPLSFDLAYATDAGEKKKIAGGVVGSADAMLFPDLLSANLTVKAIMYTADCRFGGVLCGAACPVVFMSRADSTETRLNSLAYTLKMLRAKAG